MAPPLPQRLDPHPARRPATRLGAPLTVAVAVALALLLTACGGESSKPPAAPAAGAAASAAGRPGGGVPVTTVAVQKRSLDLLAQATGTATPVATVDLKPQASSVVTSLHVREGQTVQAGQLLFSLDARADQANVAKLGAQIARDQAQLADARRQLSRAQELVAQNFISRGAVDTAQASVDALQATLQTDEAALQAGRVSLSYNEVRAPSAGRIGVLAVAVGAAVQANQTTLTTLTRLDPMDVAFPLPQAQLPDLLRLLQSGQGQVRVTLPEGRGTLVGRLSFVDNAVDAGTGTVKAKARFDNARQALWPGAFVRVELQLGRLSDARVVPTAAIIPSPTGTLVYAVREGKAVALPVQVLSTQGEWSAVDGVGEDDRLVLEGRQNLRPGVPVAERKPDAAGKAAP